jgi:hypothetical protein
VKIELEPQDIEAIAQRVTELLKPILAHRKGEAEDTIFDVQGLAEYLKVSLKWISNPMRSCKTLKIQTLKDICA